MLNFQDEELEEEFRRRRIGGVKSAEDTVSIMHQAGNLLTRLETVSRPRKFDQEAKNLIEMITGEDEPRACLAEDSRDNDYVYESLAEFEGHKPSLETIKKIVELHDGSSTNRRCLLKSITK